MFLSSVKDRFTRKRILVDFTTDATVGTELMNPKESVPKEKETDPSKPESKKVKFAEDTAFDLFSLDNIPTADKFNLNSSGALGSLVAKILQKKQLSVKESIQITALTNLSKARIQVQETARKRSKELITYNMPAHRKHLLHQGLFENCLEASDYKYPKLSHPVKELLKAKNTACMDAWCDS